MINKRPFYSWKLRSLLDPSIFGYVFKYIGTVVDSSGNKLGSRFKCDEKDNEFIDIPYSALPVYKLDSIIGQKRQQFFPVFNNKFSVQSFSSIMLEMQNKDNITDEFIVDDNWQISDNYVSIRYPYMIYHIEKSDIFNKEYFSFISKVNTFIYSSSFIRSMCVCNVEKFEFVEDYPYVSIECTTILNDIGFSNKECLKLFDEWCIQNNVKRDNFSINIEDGYIYLKFFYSLNDDKPFGDFDTPIKLVPYSWSVPAKEYEDKEAVGLCEMRMWSCDDNFMFWLHGNTATPHSIYPQESIVGLSVDLDTKNAVDKITHNLEYSSLGYVQDSNGNLVITPGVCLPIYVETVQSIKNCLENIKDSDYLNEILPAKKRYFTSSKFLTVNGNVFAFSYNLKVNYSLLGKDKKAIIGYLQDEIAEKFMTKPIKIDVFSEPDDWLCFSMAVEQKKDES